MSIAETQMKNLRMYQDMIRRPQQMSFGMAAHWGLALLSENGIHAQSLEEIEDDLQQAVITHTPVLHSLSERKDVKQKHLLQAYQDTLVSISHSSKNILKFLLHAGLDKYQAAPENKQLFILTSGLNEEQAETVTRRLRENMSCIKSPNLIQECFDIANSFGAGDCRRTAADTVQFITHEIQYQYAPDVY